MEKPKVAPLYKNVDGVMYAHVGNTTVSNIEKVISCLLASNLKETDILVDKYDERCCVYIRNDRWSLHHSSIINCTNGWGTMPDYNKN